MKPLLDLSPDVPTPTPRPHRLERHGRHWEDEFAWLRDPGYPTVDTPEILSYLNDENRYFDAVMAPTTQARDTLLAELKARVVDEDAGVPWRYGAFEYRWRFAAGADYRIWERKPLQGRGAWECIIDEAARAEGCNYFDLGGWALAPDDAHLALSVDTAGNEYYSLIIEERRSRHRIAELPNTLGDPVWSKSGRYVYYLALDEQWRPAELRRYDLTTARSRCLYSEADTGFRLSLQCSQSEALLFLNAGDHETSETQWLSLEDDDTPLQLVSARRANHDYEVDHDGTALVIRSNRDAVNFSLYRTALDTPDESHWQLLREGSANRYITGFCAFSNLTVSTERHDGLDQIVLLAPGAAPATLAFPDEAYCVSLGTNAEARCQQLRLNYEALNRPPTVFDYDLESATLHSRKERAPANGYVRDNYCAQRFLIEARDGARVPVSLVHHRSFPPGPDRPLYLYGYGAYGLATPPTFSASRLSLLDRGVTFAIAHVRGGDDLGYAWYQAGKGQARTNTFNDFVDVAEGCVHRGLTGAGRIAFVGGSAGGELVGAALNAAAALAGAAVLHVPFVDVLNTMLDDTLPLTPIEWPEWGNPITDPEAFDHLLSYSPYDQLSPQAYPPMLVTAGLHDPRVTYWEPAKYVARLRLRKTDRNPLLLKTNMAAGHGGNSGRYEGLRELAEEYQFLFAVLPGVSERAASQ